MKAKRVIAVLLLVVAGLQAAWGQGFRVYKSDGTFTQFSFRTDSIVFYDGAGEDTGFGPFTPVNQVIAGKWYRYETEITFGENGKTDYINASVRPYKFLPYQGTLIIYRNNKTPKYFYKVYDLTADSLIFGPIGSSGYTILTRTPHPQLHPVTSITLSDETLTLQTGDTYQLTATVMPEDADNSAVTWKSSNTDVAAVDDDGLVTAKADGTCTVTCSADDASGVEATCEVTVVSHEYVDLGLPSGTLWATCNVGAEKPEEYGDYFAWGETSGYNSGKTTFSWATYRYWDNTYSAVTKYCTSSMYGEIDNKKELEPEDDAATANWGSGWQMPSQEQFEELINSSYTTTSWTALNGVNGRMIISKSNGKRLFLPAAGFRSGTSFLNAGSSGCGYYWSRSLRTDDSQYGCALLFNSSSIYTTSSSVRCYGRSVRPVRVQ